MFRSIILILCLVNSLLFAKEVKVDPNDAFFMSGEVDDAMAQNFTAFMAKAASNKKKEVVIVISSPGGSILSGAAMINTLQSYKLTTKCVVSNLAASMAAIFLEHCTSRFAENRSLILFHDASGSVEGETPKMQSRLTALTKFFEAMDVDTAARLKLSLEKYNQLCDREYWASSAEEAKKLNFIDDEVNLVYVIKEKELSIPSLLPSETNSTVIVKNKEANELTNFLKSFK